MCSENVQFPVSVQSVILLIKPQSLGLDLYVFGKNTSNKPYLSDKIISVSLASTSSPGSPLGISG
jgi:hypothetical protein